MHDMICCTSSVRSSGAQKLLSGIKDVPLLNMHGATQRSLSNFKQVAKSCSADDVSKVAGWQKSLEKSGVGPSVGVVGVGSIGAFGSAGSTGLTGSTGVVVSSIGFHAHLTGKLAHSLSCFKFMQLSVVAL